MFRDKHLTLPVMMSMNLLDSAENTLDLLTRFNSYGRQLVRMSNGNVPYLVLICGFPEELEKSINDQDFDSLKIFRVSSSTKNFLKFSILSYLRLNSEKIKAKIFLPADLYLNFLSSILLRMITPKRVPLQISIHGRVRNPQDTKIVAALRFSYLNFVFWQSQSIRCVSDQVYLEVKSQFDLSGKTVLISPIPIQISSAPLTTERLKTVAFLGRVHPERGIVEWVEIIKELSSIRQDFTLRIIGDGPLLLEMKRSLESISDLIIVQYTGSIAKSKVYEELRDVKVVLSTAHSEGYGLAIRESLMCGAFVCAFSSQGSELLRKRFPRLVSTFKSKEEGALLLSKQLDHCFPPDAANIVRSELSRGNEYSLETLINSWLE